MSANVEQMMYVGEKPWHGLGKKLDDPVTSDEAIRIAGLDWNVEVADIATYDDKQTEIDDWRVTRRITDDRILGLVKKGWKPIQNRDAFKMFDNILGTNKAAITTAGALRGGAIVFITAKLPEVMKIGPTNDEVERYLILGNWHYGSRPLHILFNPTRVVCENTLNIAISKESNDDVTKYAPRCTVPHNVDAKKKAKEAERIMGKALEYYSMFGEFAGHIARKNLNVAQTKNIISEVFPPNKKKIVTPTIFYHRSEVERLFDEGKDHNKIAGTAWALFNAFAEYADHDYAVRNAKTLQDKSYSIMMGGSKGLKQRSFKTISEAVMEM